MLRQLLIQEHPRIPYQCLLLHPHLESKENMTVRLLYQGTPHERTLYTQSHTHSPFLTEPQSDCTDIYMDRSSRCIDGKRVTGFGIFCTNPPISLGFQVNKHWAWGSEYINFFPQPCNIFSNSAWVCNALTEYLPIWHARGYT